MADKIVIEGVRRYDGEYDLDLVDDPLTILERRWIKKISGYVGPEVSEGWVRQDDDLYLSLAVIAMRRCGKIDKNEVLRSAEALEDGAVIRIIFEPVKEEVAEDPPAVAPEPKRSNGDSGEHSSPTSDPPGQTPSATGTPGSERSAGSVPATLVI